MNKTQKGAWFTLGIGVLLLGFSIFIFAEMLSTGIESTKLIIRLWSLLILFFMGISAVLLRRKQSPSEVDFDERDNLIRRRAVLIGFVSVWILLFLASIIPSFIAGDAGSIPVCVLPIINLGVFLIIMLVYSVAILVQYGKEGKDGGK
jgi:uncharacterized membrane-anchored protein